MCGIFGIQRLNNNQPVENNELLRAASSLRHRGPDTQSVWRNDKRTVGLAHTRLAIIDLSESGNQPFHLNTLVDEYTAVINGEIYNYQLLKEILTQNGFKFKGNSDCEIILPLFKTQGPEFVEQLDGMFAIAISTEQQLYLARDAFGKKPLYYCHKPGQYFVFASEIKALLPYSSKEISYDALGSYFKNGYVNSQCQTIWKDIRQVKPGHFLTLDLETEIIEEACYWQWQDFIPENQLVASEADWIQGYRDKLFSAVEKRLMSDVPLGAFLSGGIDSSSVVALMHAIAPETERHTFSIYFHEDSFDTNTHIDTMVKQFGLKHHAIPFRPDDFTTWFEPGVESADLLLADLSLLPMYKLASETSKDLRVVLTGDGADELLAGYDTYKASRLVRQLGPFKNILNTFLEVISPLCRMAQGSHTKKLNSSLLLSQMQKALSQSSLTDVHQAWRTIFTDETLARILTKNLDAKPFEADFRVAFEKHNWLASMQALDIGTWMHNDILPKVDRSTMAFGLEARSPFLDKTLSEYSALLPESLKMKHPKYILRKAMSGLLPDSVIWQKKSGFNTPLSKWFLEHDKVRAYAKHWLLSDEALAHGLFNKTEVDLLWQSHQYQDKHLELWNIMVFNAWSHYYNS